MVDNINFGKYTDEDMKKLLLRLLNYEASSDVIAQAIAECEVDAFNTITDAIDKRHENEG